MRNEEVRPYYEVLEKNKIGIFLKRVLDLAGGFILLVALAIPMVIIAVMIKLDSRGPVFYRQERPICKRTRNLFLQILLQIICHIKSAKSSPQSLLHLLFWTELPPCYRPLLSHRDRCERLPQPRIRDQPLL